MTEDWKEMVIFSDNLIIQALAHYISGETVRWDKVSEHRISIVLLDQAMELLMKAYLLKKKYCIYELDRNKAKDGMKKSDNIKKFLSKKRTIDFTVALPIVKKLLPSIDDEKIGKFHDLRNKIYHLSLNITENKRDRIDDFISALEDFYKAAFPGRVFNHMNLAIEIII